MNNERTGVIPPRPLTYEYLVNFYQQATSNLQWFEITLQSERQHLAHIRAMFDELQAQLAISQGQVKQLLLYLQIETQRGDTYKRLTRELMGERAVLDERLQAAEQAKMDVENELVELTGPVVVQPEGPGMRPGKK